MLGAWIRRTVFWTIDAIKGGRIREHYSDIARQMECTDRSTTVEHILQHACRTTEYYRNILSTSLYDFPVVNKISIKSDPEAFRSDAYPDEEALHVTYTSGSSGVPFRSFQNRNKRSRTVADLLYCHNQIGWRLGERYIFIRAWSSNYKQSRLKQIKQNFVTVDARNLNEPELNKVLTNMRGGVLSYLDMPRRLALL